MYDIHRAADTALLGRVPVDQEIGRRAGEYLRAFHASHGTELGDALIAATAAVHTCALWTQNRKHYPMPDLELF